MARIGADSVSLGPSREAIHGLDVYRTQLKTRLPRYVLHALAGALYQEGRGSLDEWRSTLGSKFKARALTSASDAASKFTPMANSSKG